MDTDNSVIDTTSFPNSTDFDFSRFINLDSFFDGHDAVQTIATSTSNDYFQTPNQSLFPCATHDAQTIATTSNSYFQTHDQSLFPYATPQLPTFELFDTPQTSLLSPFSLNSQWRAQAAQGSEAFLLGSTDHAPAFQFAQPLTPTVSSRSPSPLSSTASSATRPGRYDQKLTESESLSITEERLRAHFETLLTARIEEVCHANRVEFESLLRERMAEVQAECNEMLAEKDRELVTLKARLKTATNHIQTGRRKRLCPSKLIRKLERQERRSTEVRVRRRITIASESEEEEDDDEYMPSSPASELHACTRASSEIEDAAPMDDTTSDTPYLKDAPIEGPNGLREKFFKLQLTVAIQHAQLLETEEELKAYQVKLDKCRCGLGSGGQVDIDPIIHQKASPRPISRPTPPPSPSPYPSPYPSPSPSPSATVIRTFPKSPMRPSFTAYGSSEDEEEIDELADDT